MYLTKFAETLKDLMELEGVSQRSLSMHLRVERKCIRGWLKAHYFPKYSVLIKLAAYFRVRIDYLVGLEGYIGDEKGVVFPIGSEQSAAYRFRMLLKEYICMEKFSIYALAKKLDIDQKALKKWLTQNSMPSVFSIIKLAKLMGISMQELLVGEEEALTA